ncbi:MAG TPA: ABC transporter permease [Arenibacter sp.]|nr:ABC transporter permease [Arenibacter sp.]
MLLIRDAGGLAILFIMPLVLVITVTLIQDGTFRSISDTKIPILWVDMDRDKVSRSIYGGLEGSNAFTLIDKTSEEEARELVFNGKYQLAIVIPPRLTSELEQKVNRNVEGLLAKFGMDEDTPEPEKEDLEKKEVVLYFDPATQMTFKNSIKNGIDKMIFKIETETIYGAFQSQITDDKDEKIFDTDNFITFKEVSPQVGEKEIAPNSVQHNVPAWTLFAIFFIIVPLSINMVKEKSQGTFVRLRTNPVSYLTVLGGKALVYLSVCLVQFGLMLGIGVYFFPAIGLPSLDVSNKIPLLFVVAFFAGLAAIGLGLLLGTIARTQEQSAPFGATLVVILAAMGGVWVPVFIMPGFMQVLSKLSPMNWGLNAFYDVFLRNVGLMGILPDITLLFLFFILTTSISISYNERKNVV